MAINMTDLTRLKEKISKLINLASDNTNPHESDIAMKRAIKMMQRYHIEEGDLNQADIVTQTFAFSKVKMSAAETYLFSCAASSFGVYGIFAQGYYGHRAELILTGTAADVEVAYYTFDVALRKIDQQKKLYKKQHNLREKYANHYKYGLCVSIGKRMKQSSQTVEQEAGTGLVPLDTRYQQAREFYLQDHEVVADKRRQQVSSLTQQGISDGDNIRIDPAVNGASGPLLIGRGD
ncbi:MAG: hypothetical protein ACI8WB_000752 [Phenylobacterium sp.]|jgi:hypothetical protein